jgi:hypothetical protein
MPVDRALETLVRLGLAVSGRKGDLTTAELSNGGRPQNDETRGKEVVGSSDEDAETSGREGAMSETLAASKDAPSEEGSDTVLSGSGARDIQDLGAESTGRPDLENGRANLDGQPEKEAATEMANQSVQMESEPEVVGGGGDVLDGQIVYRAVRTKEALPGLERRWLGLLMRPSVWALNKETH